MILNHLRTPVWAWDGQAESKCPCCLTPLVAKRPHDKVWHWAHKQHSNQNEGTCLFDESPWALRWRLGYFKFEGWEIEVAKKAADRIHVIMAMNPTTHQVREFVGKISDKHESRFMFLLGAQTHKVAWLFNGEEWASARQNRTRDQRGLIDPLKPKAKGLYDRIVAAGQGALLHYDGQLYREWVKPGAPVPHTGIWFPLEGEKAQAVLDNYSKVELPYENTPAPAPQPKRENPLAKLQV